MEANNNPSTPLPDATERALLNFLLSGPDRTLDQLAAACNTDILSLAEHILTPRFQAALDSIRRAAAALSETRALACGQVALAALSAACDEQAADPAERRRAASALTRFLPKPTRPPERGSASDAPVEPPVHGPELSIANPDQSVPRSALASDPSPQTATPAPVDTDSLPIRARDRPEPALAA